MITYKFLPKTNGIAVYDGKALIRTVPDIPIQKRKLRKLCRTCTRLRLDPEHLDDVLEDTRCTSLT